MPSGAFERGTKLEICLDFSKKKTKFVFNANEQNNICNLYNMKRFLFFSLAVLSAVFLTVSCGEKEPEISQLTLNQTSVSVYVGETVMLKVNEAASGLSWSSDNTSVASVSDNGLVKGTGAGTAKITVTAGSVSATCTVTVYNHVSSVTLDQSSIELAVGATATLKATVSPDGVLDNSVNWSSTNDKVATVANGVVTAVGPGAAVISATSNDGSVSATCAVTVFNTVSGVTLDQSELKLAVGGTATLTAKVTPDNVKDNSVTWSSSNTSVATVNGGVVTAAGAGEAVITVKTNDGGHTATCKVTVLDHVTGVSLDQTEARIAVGKTLTLKATVIPTGAMDESVTWYSSNSAVASVSNGVVTALNPGEVVITVSTNDGGHTATCKVTVWKEVSSITLDITSASIVAGASVTITAVVSPSDATYKDVTWTTSDASVATVSGGKVTGVAPGTATITATTTDGGLKATATITVVGLSFKKDSMTVTMGDKKNVQFEYNATDSPLVWTSSNEGVATVDENGAVTGVSVGSCTVTATSEKYGLTATITIIVKSGSGMGDIPVVGA